MILVANITLILLSVVINPVMAIESEDLKSLIGSELTQQKQPPPPLVPKGKASIELENNEGSRLVIDYSKEAAKTDAERAMDEQKQREKKIKFKAYYKKPEICYDPESAYIRIECANEYIRAKARFEDLYNKGKI
jgi:hypothetical protein